MNKVVTKAEKLMLDLVAELEEIPEIVRYVHVCQQIRAIALTDYSRRKITRSTFVTENFLKLLLNA